VNFYFGYDDYNDKSSSYSVRLVRGGERSFYNIIKNTVISIDFANNYDAKNTQIVELKNTTSKAIKVKNVIVSDAGSYWVNLFVDDKPTCRPVNYTQTAKTFIIPANSFCEIGVGFSPMDNLNVSKSIAAAITLKTVIRGIAIDKTINVVGIGRAQDSSACNWGVCQLKHSWPPINAELLGLPRRYAAAKFWYGSLIDSTQQNDTASVGNLVVFAQNSMNIAGHVGVVIQTLPVVTMLSMNDVKDQNGVKLRKWSVRPVDWYPNQTVTWSPLITGFNNTDATKHYGFIDWKSSLY
jgi:hypothetical protein